MSAFNMAAFAYTPVMDKLGVYNTSTDSYGFFSYNKVNLTNKGADVKTDMPAFIIDGRTMVPVRVISEGLGANVNWLDLTKQISISYGDLLIVLSIGSEKALVNGQSITLPDGVPAVLAKYNGVQRTLVPLRFVAEQMGADVQWDGETYTVHINKPIEATPYYEVTEFSSEETGDSITLKTSENASYKVKFFSNKLVIDLLNARLGDQFSVPDIKSNWIEQVRYSQYTGYTDIKNVVRVVFQLKNGVAYPDNVSV
ncbi:MAG: stalk domain-containing protein, partial [Clostridiales bacterium]|nr:stalk domain-containing protein [Clostridiales bacterium]